MTMNRTITPQELKNLSGNTVIIDVRRKSDLEADPQKIPDATWRDPEQVGQWSAALTPDQEVIIYCVRGGSVSNSVLDHLLGKNIKARFIEGGIVAWKEAGGETTGK